MDDFSLLRDYKKIVWKDTLQVNLIRAACAGPVWSVVALFAERDLKLAAIYLFLMPLMYALVIVPMGTAAILLSNMKVPFAGLFVAFLSLMITVGDPLAYFIWRRRPHLLPLERFKPFNFALILFVLQNNKQPDKLDEEGVDSGSRRAWVSDLKVPPEPSVETQGQLEPNRVQRDQDKRTAPATAAASAEASTYRELPSSPPRPRLESGERTAHDSPEQRAPRETSQPPGRRTLPFLVGGGAVLASIAVVGTGYWYSRQHTPAQSRADVVQRAAPTAERAPDHRSGAQPAPLPAAQPVPNAAAGEQAVSAEPAVQGREGAATEVARSRPNSPPMTKERTVARAQAARPAERKPEPAPAVQRPADEVPPTAAAKAQVASRTTCQGTGGLYRLTCEIEGPANYFRCAPDGRNWNHDIPGCDRRSNDLQQTTH